MAKFQVLVDGEVVTSTDNAHAATIANNDAITDWSNGAGDKPRVIEVRNYEVMMFSRITLEIGSILCEDEGCPQHGTDHVCVSAKP